MKSSLLAALAASKGALVLRNKSNPNKVAYTKEERQHCKLVLAVLAPLASISITSVEIPSQIQELVEVTHDSMTEASRSVASIAKKAFRDHSKAVVEFNEKPENAGNQIPGFPKVRDATSEILLFRAAAEELNVPQDKIDEIFPKPGTKKQAEVANG